MAGTEAVDRGTGEVARLVVADMPSFLRLLRSGALDRFGSSGAELLIPDHLAAAIGDHEDRRAGRWLAENARRVTIRPTAFAQAVREASLHWHMSGGPEALRPDEVLTQAQTWFAVDIFLRARLDGADRAGRVVLLSDLPYARLVAESVCSPAELRSIDWLPRCSAGS